LFGRYSSCQHILHTVDGAVNVRTNTPVVINVRDSETGINYESLSLIVNGVEVIHSAVISIIDRGLSISYIPAGFFTALSEYTVVFSATDLDPIPNTVTEVHSFTTGSHLSTVDWEVFLSVWTLSGADTATFPLSFGAAMDASPMFDMTYDDVYPVAPPGSPYAFFPLSDESYPYYNMLQRDIRSLASTRETYKVMLEIPGTACGVKWNPISIPASVRLYIGAAYPPFEPSDDDWVDMSGTGNFAFLPAQVVHIRSISAGIDSPPYLVSVMPAIGATSVSPSTDIVLSVADAETGVNAGSIRFWVNEEEVTSALSITTSGSETIIRYNPPADFSPMTSVNWSLYCKIALTDRMFSLQRATL
jgi:hypothetical protein